MNAPTELLTILNGRSKDLNRQKYAYELGTPGQFGLDVVVNEDPDVDESSMSFILPFADGKRRDGVGDLLEVGGINCERHQKNPVSLLDHGKQVLLPIGKCEDPATGAYTVEIDPVSKIARARVFIYQGKGLANTDPAKENEHALLCAQIFDLWAKRFIRAGSIGYQVVAGRELGPDYETGTPKGVHLLNVLMLECSTVVMPANMDTVKGLRSPADLAKEVLCMGAVCGKPLSPVLVKSFSAFAPEKKVMMGWEGKSETVPVPLENIPDTKIPPPEWKPGVGAEKSLSAVTAMILGALSAGTMGWTLAKLMGWLSDHGVDEAEAQAAIMDLQKRGNLEVNGENIQKKELPRQDKKAFGIDDAIILGLVGAGTVGIGWLIRKVMRYADGLDQEDANSEIMRLEREGKLQVSNGQVSAKGLQKKALVDDPTADYRVVAVGANGERILYRGPDKEIAYRIAYQAKKSDLYNSVVLHGETTGPRRMKTLRGRYGKSQSKGLEVRFEWRENPSGTPWERRKIWVRDGGSERQMSFTDLAQQYGQEVAKRMISTSIRKGTSNWHEVPGVKSLPRQGTKSLNMSSVRKKYRPTKTLRRRLRKSVPGSSLVHVAPSDLNAAREMAEAKGLKFDHVGSVGGLSRVKLMGDDSGKSVRGRKSFPLQGEKVLDPLTMAALGAVASGTIYSLIHADWESAREAAGHIIDYLFTKNPSEVPKDSQQRERLRKQKEREILQYFEDLERQGKVEIQGGKIRKRGGKSLPLTGIKRCVVQQESDGWYARFSPESGDGTDGAPDDRQDIGPFDSEQEARQVVTRQNPGLYIHRKGVSRKDLPTAPIPAKIVKQYLYGMLSRQKAVAELVAKAGMTPEQAEAEIDAVIRDIRSKERKGIKSTGDTEFNQGVAARLSGEQQNDNPYPIGSDAADSWNSGWVGGQGKTMRRKDMSTRGSIDLDPDVRRQIDNSGAQLSYAKVGNGGHYLYFAPGTDIFKVRTALERGGHTFKITGEAEGWVKPRAKSLKAKGKSMDNTDDVYMDDDPLAEASKDMGMNPEHPFSAQVLKRLHEKALEDLEEGDSWMSHLEHPEVKKFVQKHLEGKAAHLDEIEALHSKHHPELPGLGDAETKDLDEEELGETEGELDAIGDELDDVVGDLDEEFDDTEEDKDLDTMDDDSVPADSASEDEPTPEEALEGMETADGAKHLRRPFRRRVKSLKDEEFDEEFIGKRLRRKGIEEVEELTEDEKRLIRRKRMERREVKSFTQVGASVSLDDGRTGKVVKIHPDGWVKIRFDDPYGGNFEELVNEDRIDVSTTKRLQGRRKSVCPECGIEGCDCVKSMDDLPPEPPPEFTDQIDNGIEAMEEKGLEDHEMSKVGEAAQFANELATSDALDEEKRMKAFHYHKTLEGMGQIEDLAAEQKSEFVGDPQFWQEEGAEAEHKDMGTEHPGAMAGSAEEAAVNGPAAEAQIPPAKSIHPHRQACKDAAQFFGDTASTKDWGEPHKQHASIVAKALEEVAAAPINKPEPVTDEAVIEVGEMGEKSRKGRKLTPRRKSVEDKEKEEEEVKAFRKSLIEQQKQVKELRRMINGIGNMTR